MHFLELARLKEDDHPSLSGFLQVYDNGEGEEFYVPLAGADAVRVMTIHKAKGLEFRVVVLPFFTLGGDRRGTSGSKAPRYILGQQEEGLALYHVNDTLREYSALADQEAVREKMSAFFSELNNAYVALTRAVCEMYVFIPPRSGSSENRARVLIPQDMVAVGEPAPEYPGDRARDAVSVVEVSPPACRDWLGFLDDEFIRREDMARHEDRQLGIVLHEVLSRVRTVAPGGLETSLQAALNAVALPVPADVPGMVRAFLSAPAVMPFFAQGERVVHTEYDLVGRDGRTRRVDRLIMDGDSVTVMDLKTSKGEDTAKARQQVLEYMALLREVHAGKKVRGVLAFIREKEVLDVRDIHG